MSFHATAVGLPDVLGDGLTLGVAAVEVAAVEVAGVGVPGVGAGCVVVHPAHRRSANAVLSRCFMSGVLHR
jgi:hypothetical protein